MHQSVSEKSLGVGILYNPSLDEFLKKNPYACDYIEIMPDMLWTDEGIRQKKRFTLIKEWWEKLLWMADHFPLTAHNISFSLGSGGELDLQYLDQIAKMHDKFSFRWHSDHLSFIKVHCRDEEYNAGMAVPVPYDQEVLNLIANKIYTITDAIACPFIIENNVSFIDYPDQDYTEEAFLNALVRWTGCGLLLDVHNVYTNSLNHNFDPYKFIDNLDLSAVIEIHIAGGSYIGDVYTDSHSGPCPQEVWDLLQYTVSRTPNLKGITFEFHESYFHLLKFKGISEELEKAKEIFNSVKR